MNILLLGNGFDLYHKLPTRYDNFLHTIDFLVKNYKPEMKTIADVFGDSRIQKEDAFIYECYLKHKEVYEKIALEESDIEEIKSVAKENLWFSYLIRIFDNKLGWIDLEKEIDYVLKTFEIFLKSLGVAIRFNDLNDSQYYVVEKFDFFSEPYHSGIIGGPTKKLKSDYVLEYPLGSGVKVANKEKIILRLLEDLNDFAKLLKKYLYVFIETALFGIKEKSLDRCPAITHIDKAITFNYTNSYECFYFNNPIFHIHGSVNNKIILGINPDENDQIETIDTSFVKFKKYFQRTQYDTDSSYINWLKEIKEPKQFASLMVMGHSLDVTDKDIILELFDRMDEIIILYHSDEAKNTYILNLINMYGKEGLDVLRKQKRLTFLSLDMDFSEIVKKRSESSFEGIFKSWVTAI